MNLAPKAIGSTQFDLYIPAEPGVVHNTLRNVRQSLRRQGHRAGEAFSWELALAEAMNNVVEHAYSGPEKGDIRLTLSFTPTELLARFTDTGRAMPRGCVPDPAEIDLDVPTEQLPEGGFGWSMIHALSREVTYRRIKGVNYLNLRISLDE